MERKSIGAILLRAKEIRDATIERCPHYAEKLRGIRFEVSGRMTRTAGQAVYRQNLVKLSLPFFADAGNFASDFENTVTHELAHLVVGVQGRDGRPHGPQWRLVHRSMGGDGKRCHALDLAEGYSRRRTATRVAATCHKCGGPISLGPTQAKRHARIVAGGGKGYSHSRCPR